MRLPYTALDLDRHRQNKESKLRPSKCPVSPALDCFCGVVKSLVSPFLSKLSISPSPMSLAAIALIDASAKAFLQLNLPSWSFINSTKSPEIRVSAAWIFQSIIEYYDKFPVNLPIVIAPAEPF